MESGLVDSFIGFTDPISSLSHLGAAVAALVASYFLVARGHGNGVRQASLIIFSFSLVFLFSMSGVYHLLDRQSVARMVFQRLDHAAIWVLVAGTFTPIHIILFRNIKRWGILVLVWSIAITGLVLKTIYFNQISPSLSVALYLGFGWIGLFTGIHFVRQYGMKSARLFFLGGLSYSIGAIWEFNQGPSLWPGVMGSHEIFHFFVLAGALLHWTWIFRWADHPVINTVVFDVKIRPDNQYLAKSVGESILVKADSLQSLREKIQQEIVQRFHHSLRPAQTYLRFINEEVLTNDH